MAHAGFYWFRMEKSWDGTDAEQAVATRICSRIHSTNVRVDKRPLLRLPSGDRKIKSPHGQKQSLEYAVTRQN